MTLRLKLISVLLLPRATSLQSWVLVKESSKLTADFGWCACFETQQYRTVKGGTNPMNDKAPHTGSPMATTYLCFDVRKFWHKTHPNDRPPFSSHTCHFGHLESLVTIGFGQMLCNLPKWNCIRRALWVSVLLVQKKATVHFAVSFPTACNE